jgi:L-2,4-diaminobutyrate transaminase
MSTTETLARKGQAHYLQPFTSIAQNQQTGPRVMARGEGCRLWDTDGKEFLDAMAGLWCVNIGYGRKEMAEAVQKQTEELAYFHSFVNMANEPAITLADKVASLAPKNINKVFFGLSGSDANDTNVKIVWYYNNLRGLPEKKKIISRKGGYHGVTLGGCSMSGLPPLHAHFDMPVNDRFIHVTRPHLYWDAPEGMDEAAFTKYLAEELEQKIIDEGPDTVAAFIAEPVQGAGGVIVPPEGYFAAVKPILDKYDILFIADEVVCGYGRLGTWFGSQYYDFEPDLMTTAKGLTSGYIPLSANLVSDRVWEVLKEGSPEVGPFAHGYTYSGHPVSTAAGVKNLEIIEREGLVENAARMEPIMQQRFREAFADHPLIGNVRGTGCLAGLELVADKEKKTPFDPKLGVGPRLYNLLLEEGLISRPIVNSMVFCPPLIFGEDELGEIIDKFSIGLNRLQERLVAENIWKG